MEELEKVNNRICSLNNCDMIFRNCGSFATIRNTVSPGKPVHVTLPIFTIPRMCLLGAQKGVVGMKEYDINRVYKQTNNGCCRANAQSFSVSCVG